MVLKNTEMHKFWNETTEEQYEYMTEAQCLNLLTISYIKIEYSSVYISEMVSLVR